MQSVPKSYSVRTGCFVWYAHDDIERYLFCLLVSCLRIYRLNMVCKLVDSSLLYALPITIYSIARICVAFLALVFV